MDNSWNLTSPEQILSLLGSVVILIAYYLTVSKPDKKLLYFSLSLLGGVALFFVALIYQNIGFIFLEVSWISINAWGIWKVYQSDNA
ncbi:MAG: hypothetical protein COB41_01600 [Proteobacteria bacterium]|nr:MAG: hypothetical protein COB41_01600 [Pseudomonadota bacterium]